MLEYLNVMEWRLIHMLSTPTVARKINNANFISYAKKAINEEMNSVDTRRTEAVFYSFKFNKLERRKIEEPLEGNEIKIADLSYMPPAEGEKVEIVESLDMPPLEGDEEEVKSEPEESVAERVKLNPRKRKKTGTGITSLAPNNLLTTLPVLLAQIKAGNNSNKLKNEIRKILYLHYQHNKITKKVYNNLIKSL